METPEKNKYTLTDNLVIRSLEGASEKENEDSRIVCGYAVKFDVESQNIGFIEIIRKGAITEDVILASDIYARFNHDENTVLARSRYGEGTLALELRDDGLYYEYEAPHTAIGDELLEHIKRGEMTTSSFAFSLPKDGSGERWYNNNGVLYREILKIERLYDVSCVYEPAYLATSCSTRAKEMVDKSDAINSMYDSMMAELEQYKI